MLVTATAPLRARIDAAVRRVAETHVPELLVLPRRSLWLSWDPRSGRVTSEAVEHRRSA